MFLSSTLGIPNSSAQVVADPSAAGNQRATILRTGNGITQVNIQTPSAAGVSRNVYSQFDVQAQGVVLNNSSTSAQTQLGGWIAANPSLSAGSARVILNEVNATRPSQLHGFVEVGGQRAEVVIANPAGIQVNGGGFINASGVTLTTGTPVLNGGQLESYRVSGGLVSIQGAGLDTRDADYTHILARAVQLNAGLWAKELRVVTGANQLNAAQPTLAPVPIAASSGESKPAFALDVAALGGMYAGQIFLVGTEAGLGVNNRGTLGASAGDVVVQANGWITNSAEIRASGNVDLRASGQAPDSGVAHGIRNNGTVYAAGNTTLRAEGEIDNQDSGQLLAAQTTQLQAGSVINRGLIDGAITRLQTSADAATGQVSNVGTGRLYGDLLSIQTAALVNAPQTVAGVTSAPVIAARQRLDLGLQTLDNSDHAVIFSAGDLAIGGQLDGSAKAVGRASTVRNGSATVEAQGQLSIAANNILNINDHFAYSVQLVGTQYGIREDLSSTYFRVFDRYIYEPVVTQDDPGQIVAGGDIQLRADQITNQNSRIVAGGTLGISGTTLNNITVSAQRRVNDVGTQWSWGVTGGHSSCWPCRWVYDWGMVPSGYNVNTYTDLTVAQGVASQVPQAPTTFVSSTASPNGNSAMAAKTAAAAGITLPDNALFHAPSTPNASYLVETDPRFANYRTWLSSDYMVQAAGVDPSVTQKRLGDGFYEQKLIREQVAALTGRRFLGDYTSDEQQYQALMNAGITFAQAHKLRPGIALSAAQVAQLTSDIVWLVEQSVTLPDGTQQKALVPQLYAVVREGDVLASGALLSGAQVQLAADGTLNNTGTIAGRKLVQMEADTLNNLAGWVQGERVVMAAQQDINHIGGDIRAQQSLNLQAGGDLNIISTTAKNAGAAGDVNVLNQVAGLSVSRAGGSLLAAADGSIRLMGAQLKSAGDARLQAGTDIQLAALSTGETLRFQGSGDAVFHQAISRSSQIGSTLSAQGDLQLQAAQDIRATAANIAAQGAAQLQAGGDITLLAGQTRLSSDLGWTATDKGVFSSTTTSTRIQESSAQAQSSSVSGKNVDISAGRNLVSVGTQFSAAEQLQVQGGQTQAFYEALNVSQRQVDVQSSSSLLGLSLENKSSSDSRLQTTAVASRLVSSDKIDVRVGEWAILQGAQLQAQAIAFTATDPSRGAELVLGSSIETTQSSHTEKNETLGVWQAMQGQGSTVQTAKLTTLDGQVSFDAGLQVTVQTGSNANATGGGAVATLSGAANLQNQIDLLSAQPGLAYLKDLQANPKVNWEQVKLIHEQWSYSQQGLTPAGAALLSIAVAAYAPGLGNSTMTSLSSAVGAGGAAALNAGFIALQSQAAVALVNNGGDLGKTLAQLGSSESIQQLLTAMATAGAIQALNPGAVPTATGQSGAGAQAVSTVQAANDFLGNLQRNITNNLASAVIDSAISGKPLDASRLGQALTGALVTAGMAAGANAIGDGLSDVDLNAFTQKVAHAVLGCAAGAATAQGGCAPGALGAVVGEMTVAYAHNAGMSEKNALNLAKVMAAAAGLIAGGGGANAAAVNIASTTGANAAQNNYLMHNKFNDEEGRLRALKQKKTNGTCDANCASEIEALETLDRKRDEEIAPWIAACEKAGRTNCKGEVIAAHYAASNGFGKEAMRWESNPGTRGSPFSFNGCPPSDKGGCSYGPLQIAADTGLMKNFMNDLRANPSTEAQLFYRALEDAGGVQAAQNKDPQFLATWYKLTAADPQFVQYQIDTLINRNLYPVATQELQQAGIAFEDLSPAMKEMLFSAAVQHGSGMVDKNKGLDNLLERSFAQAETGVKAPSFPTYTRKDLVYGEVEDRMETAEREKAKLIMQRESFITQQRDLERQKSRLLEQGLGADTAAVQAIRAKTQALDQKIEGLSLKVDSITDQVQKQDQYIQDAASYLKEQAQESIKNGEQFIRDFYEQRTQMYPSEAKRYKLEMESILQQYRQEQKAKTKP